MVGVQSAGTEASPGRPGSVAGCGKSRPLPGDSCEPSVPGEEPARGVRRGGPL